MKCGFQVCFAWALVGEIALGWYAQAPSAPEPPRPLVPSEAIPMPGIQGRFEHFGFDGRNQRIVAALGNNSVEVIEISARVRRRRITGKGRKGFDRFFLAARLGRTTARRFGFTLTNLGSMSRGVPERLSGANDFWRGLRRPGRHRSYQ